MFPMSKIDQNQTVFDVKNFSEPSPIESQIDIKFRSLFDDKISISVRFLISYWIMAMKMVTAR
jgi:hypothetical protein